MSWGNYDNQRRLQQAEEQRRRAEREAEDLRYELERRRDQEERERVERRQEREQEMYSRTRQASDWPTAFMKNRYLMMRERNQCYGNGDSDYDRDMDALRAGWDESLAEIDLAANLWAEEQEAFERYQREMRGRIAARLRQENPNSELADYIEDNDIEGWMDW